MNAGSDVDGGLYSKDDEKRESQVDLLEHSQDSQGIPQLCDISLTVKKVGFGSLCLSLFLSLCFGEFYVQGSTLSGHFVPGSYQPEQYFVVN